MKVLKNILKWLLCVFLTFTTIFTINVICSEGYAGVPLALNLPKYEKEMEENADEVIKGYDEMTRNFFSNMDNSENDSDSFLSEQYKKYPLGSLYFLEQFVMMYGMGKTIIYSAIAGIILGTVVFLLINSKEKKGIKLVIVAYIISIILVGTFVGILNNVEDKLNIIKSWKFPTDYVIPITIAFGLVILVRVIKQKDLARKLNEKLKERHTEK